MKYLHLLVTLLFLLFAYWQFNDPDWPAWVATYGFVAVVAALYAFEARVKPLVYLGLAILLIWWATYIPDFIAWLSDGAPSITGQMKAESPFIERTREFLGLTLALIAVGGYSWGFRSRG